MEGFNEVSAPWWLGHSSWAMGKGGGYIADIGRSTRPKGVKAAPSTPLGLPSNVSGTPTLGSEQRPNLSQVRGVGPEWRVVNDPSAPKSRR
eukprot:scaffold52816_cov59-Phaeocystis_antarctica.AAC.1